MRKILLLPFILLLLVSFGSAELITGGIEVSDSCGETQFSEINYDGFEYLIYNECQEWRFPRILTNIKTTFVDNGLNAKVILIESLEFACINRIEKDNRRNKQARYWEKIIHKWFKDYTPRDEDVVVNTGGDVLVHTRHLATSRG